MMGEFGCAHKFELQVLEAPRRKLIFLVCFLGPEYFAQRFNRPVDGNGQTNFWPFFWPPKSLFLNCFLWVGSSEDGKTIIAGYPIFPTTRVIIDVIHRNKYSKTNLSGI